MFYLSESGPTSQIRGFDRATQARSKNPRASTPVFSRTAGEARRQPAKPNCLSLFVWTRGRKAQDTRGRDRFSGERKTNTTFSVLVFSFALSFRDNLVGHNSLG
ncbi:hypothetical protein BJX68DRAFT_239725 [Aspergillus pseudodeflectus]|uniref:Uncharacterized protein n=1 Tax=Aspergillus pseudodeflectus TaxID=176178 RepID=A0ABR4K8W2_9EURO